MPFSLFLSTVQPFLATATSPDPLALRLPEAVDSVLVILLASGGAACSIVRDRLEQRR